MAVQQADVMIVQAKQAKSKNDVVRARSLLSQVIKTDPRNEEAWLLFADVAEKKEHAIYSLEQVLKLNPVNMEALDRLNALKAPPPAPVVPTSIPSPQSTIERVATTVPRAAAHETVILDERMHGAMFILPFLMALVGIVLSLFIGSLAGYGMDLIAGIAFLGFMLGALLELVRTTVRYFTGHLILTNKRIVIKRGLLNRQSYEILLRQVEGIGIRQPLLGRILGFGTIVVTGTGGARPHFSGLHDPQRFRERAQEEIALLQGRQF
jgi:ABC-type glycerol-3-phosphate transport system permease component